MGDHGDDISIVNLYANQQVMLSEIRGMKATQKTNHSDNRNSIHDLRNEMQDVRDDVWKLKIKMAGYSALAGVVTTVIVKLVDYLIHLK